MSESDGFGDDLSELETEADELLEWDDDDGPLWRLLIVMAALASAGAVVVYLSLRAQRTARATAHADNPAEPWLGPRQRAVGGVVINVTEPEPSPPTFLARLTGRR